MNDFKVGDKVKVLGTSISVGYVGNIKAGDVVTVSDAAHDRCVKCNGEGYRCWISIREIELVEHEYPNPPRPHMHERIEHTKGADIQFWDGYAWMCATSPSWNKAKIYRVAPTPAELADIKTQAKIDKYLGKIEKLKLTLGDK